MRGGAAVGRDERQHLVQVEERGVGGGEVARHQDERVSRVRHAGGLDATKAGEHTLCDVVEIGRALAEVAADGLERGAEAGERIVHGPLRRRSGVDPGVDLVLERRILGDHRLCLEDLLRGSSRGLPALVELARDDRDGVAHPGAFGIRTRGAGSVLRGGHRLGHADDRSLGDPEADPHPAQLAHPAASWSWSVVRSSVSVSSTFSAPSPSAVRVT